MRAWWVALCWGALACEDAPSLTVISPEGLFDPQMVDFGPRTIGVTHELTTTLTNPRVGDLTVQEVRFDPPVEVYAARLVEGGTLRGAFLSSGSRIAIKILYAPREEKSYDTSMLVVFDDFAVPLELRGSGRRILDADLDLQPDTVAFQGVELGREVKRTVEIENVGDLRSVLREVRLQSNAREAKRGLTTFFVTRPGMDEPLRDVTIDPRGRVFAELYFKPERVGAHEEELLFVLTNGRSVGLPVSGSGVAAGTLGCTPSPADLGSVRRGQWRDLPVECTSTGGVYTIQTIGLRSGSSDRFALVDPPAAGTVIGVGERVTLQVRFQSEGVAFAHSGYIDIGSAHGARHDVPLAAAVEPPPADQTALTASLVWDTVTTDFDVHLVRNGEEPFDALNDCFFRYRNQEWGSPGNSEDNPFLDRDDVDGNGPEEINLAVAAEPTYDLFVHYYKAPSDIPTSATAGIKFRGQLAFERTKAFSTCGQLWHVARVRFDAGPNPTVSAVDQMSDAYSQADCKN